MPKIVHVLLKFPYSLLLSGYTMNFLFVKYHLLSLQVTLASLDHRIQMSKLTRL